MGYIAELPQFLRKIDKGFPLDLSLNIYFNPKKLLHARNNIFRNATHDCYL